MAPPERGDRSAAPSPPPGSKLLALAYFVALGLILIFTHGHLVSTPLLALVALHASYTVVELRRADRRAAAPGSHGLLLAMLLVFALCLAGSDQLIYAEPGEAQQQLDRWLPVLPLLVGLAFVALLVRRRRERAGRIAFYVAVAGVVACLIAARVLVLRASPAPHIDVWTSSVEAVRHFLDGRNPYAQSYADIYRGRYDYAPGFPYLPGYLLWASAWSAATGSSDVRVSLLAAELVTAGLVWGWLRSLGVERTIGTLLAALWLALPIDLFVLEQAWIDPVLLMGFSGAIWALTARRWLACGALLGFSLATKQYALIGAAFFVLHAWRAGGLRAAARLAAACALVFAALCVPFFVADAGAFWRNTVTSWWSARPRRDALSLPAWIAYVAEVEQPASLRRLFAPFAILSVAAWAALLFWFARRKPPTIRHLAVAVSLAYGWMFLFAKQAFCNYYYFLSFFLLAAAACQWMPPARQALETDPSTG
jgi:hypothetical protein